jgi:hypothetical protein
MVTKRAKKFTTPVGNFEYIRSTVEYFEIGLRQIPINNQYTFLMASPEKALCDLICYTPGLRIQSAKAMTAYLDEDMRIDLSDIEKWDLEIINQAIQVGKKRGELKLLLEVLNAQ